MILSCNSINPSIWGVALSWKYNPHGLAASQDSSPLPNSVRLTPNNRKTNPVKQNTSYNRVGILCKGKLTKAWGLGGLFKHHSNSYKLCLIVFVISHYKIVVLFKDILM